MGRIQQINARIDESVTDDGYSNLIEQLLGIMTDDQLNDVLSILDGDMDEDWDDDREATCENCGAACEYDSELCLCADCIAKAEAGPEKPRTCILTGAEGENPEDCTTHDHEPPAATEPTKTFAVWVHDRRLVKYIVNADSAEDAKRMVEESDDADRDFGGSGKDGEWYVTEVVEC